MKKLTSLALALALVALTMVPALAADTTVITNFPLAGQIYEGYVGSDKNVAYNATWTEDGRLWQPSLPGTHRATHTLAITLVAGYTYKFHGVEAVLSLDNNCDGVIDQPDFIVRSNESIFTVASDMGKVIDDYRVIWGTVWSSTDSGGFEVIATPIDSAK